MAVQPLCRIRMASPIVICVYPFGHCGWQGNITLDSCRGACIAGSGSCILREAFVEHGAVQCGFTVEGTDLTAYALLNHNPNQKESADIRFAPQRYTLPLRGLCCPFKRYYYCSSGGFYEQVNLWKPAPHSDFDSRRHQRRWSWSSTRSSRR